MVKAVVTKSKTKKLNRSWGGNITIFLMLAVVGVFMALPFVYAVVQSLKPLEEIFLFPPRFFVRNPTWSNYAMLSKLTSNLWVPFSRYAFNSIFITVVGTVGHVLLASMAAYPLAKCRFPGSKLLFQLVVLSLLFTGQVTHIPQYIVMARIGFINTFSALILPPIAASLGLFLMKQFMTQIPDSLIEAATIDGAHQMQIFWRVVMPSVKPAWLTLTIFAFQSIWNRTGMSFIYDETLKVLPTVLRQIAEGGIARAGVGAAASVILMIPPIITFVLVQSNVLETMAQSGIKG